MVGMAIFHNLFTFTLTWLGVDSKDTEPYNQVTHHSQLTIYH